MFQELMPLLAQRTLLLVVSRVGTDEIRVNVIPQRSKSGDDERNGALIAPLSVTGTPKELDEGLPEQLVEFVGAHLGLSSTLKSVKEQMDAAAKAAREAARKTPPGKSGASPVKPAPSTQNGPAVEIAGTASPEPAAPEQLSGNLFGDAPACGQ